MAGFGLRTGLIGPWIWAKDRATREDARDDGEAVTNAGKCFAARERPRIKRTERMGYQSAAMKQKDRKNEASDKSMR